MDQIVCPTHLVQDAPASEDAFGAHQRIATAIAQLVETSQGGKCVGLLGTWGAGKSTVVQLLQKQLEQEQARVVWVFDAWAHEGDSLRRTFLESLIERLTLKKWLEDKAHWNERLEYLAGRRKVTEQASRPHLSPLAIVLAISLLFVPIGSSLFDSRLDKGLSLSLSLAPDWPAIAGLFLTFLPLVILGAYVSGLFLVRRSAKEVSDALRDALTLFVRQTDTAQRTETLESGEPTTLEFERAFFDVMAAALTPTSVRGANESRRLVIVIDNLDRVNTEQALAVWSTLQIFVRHRDSRETWLDNLWCVLPFDGDAIRRLWPQDSPRGVNVAESFLDKTFQVRFEVPLPLLSDWKDYIMARLKEALPEHSDDDCFRVYRLYAVRREQGMPAPTPRELKLFVNQVGSLHRQWQDTIPLPDLAYYALLQRDEEPITSDTIAQFPLPGEVGLVSDNVRAHLAAMAFGVPISSAQELLLREPVMHALESADHGALKALSDVNHAFALVFEQTLWRCCEEWPQAEAGKLLHAVIAIEKSEIGHDVPQWRLKQWFDRLEGAIRQAGTWAPMDASAVDGILALSGHRSGLAASLFSAFISAPTTIAAWGRPAAMAAFVSDYTRLESGLKDWVHDFSVDVPGGSDVFGTLALELVKQDRDGRLWANFRPAASDVLLRELAEPARTFGPEALAAVRVAMVSMPAADWGAFASSAVERVRSSEGREAQMLSALHVLWSKGSADFLGRLLDDSWAWLDRDRVRGEFNALAFLTIARVDPTLASLDRFASRVAHSSLRDLLKVTDDASYLAQPLARTVDEIGDAGILFTLASSGPDAKALAFWGLHELAKLGPSAHVFPAQLLIEKWHPTFYDGDPYETAMLLARNNPGFAQACAEVPFTWSSSSTSYASIYAGVLDGTDGAVPETLITSCLSAIQAVPSSGWVSSFEGDGRLARLMAALGRRGYPANTDAVATALATLAPKLAELPVSGAPWRRTAFDGLAPDAREGVVASILENAFRSPEPDLHSAFDLIGPAVFQSPSLVQGPEWLATAARFVLKDLNDVWLAELARAASLHARRLGDANPRLQLELAAAFEARKSVSPTEQSSAALRELGSALALAGVRTPGARDVASA